MEAKSSESKRPSRPVNVNQLVQDERFSVEIKTYDHPEEMRTRLALEEADADLRRRKDFILFVAVILGIGIVMSLCAWISVRANSTPDDKKWATSILTSIVSGGVGYLSGKASK